MIGAAVIETGWNMRQFSVKCRVSPIPPGIPWHEVQPTPRLPTHHIVLIRPPPASSLTPPAQTPTTHTPQQQHCPATHHTRHTHTQSSLPYTTWPPCFVVSPSSCGATNISPRVDIRKQQSTLTTGECVSLYPPTHTTQTNTPACLRV